MKFVPPTSMPETQGLFGKVGEVYGKVETKHHKNFMILQDSAKSNMKKQKADILASEAF